MPEDPLDTAEFVAPSFPFKNPPAHADAAPPPIKTTPPPALPPAPPKAAQTTKPAADRIYRRNLMALAGTISNQMVQSDVMSHELATQVGCPPETIDALLTGKSGELTLDGLEGIAEKLGMVLVVQMRLFGPTTGPQPAGRAGTS